MAKAPYEQLSAEVARAELIPRGRFLTAEEIELLDDLAARLRQNFSDDRSEMFRDLLDRVSAVRTYSRDEPVSRPAPVRVTSRRNKTTTAATVAASKSDRKKAKEPSRGEQKAQTRRYSLELRRIAQAGRPMSPADAQILNKLVGEIEVLSRTVPMARTLLTQALDTRAYLTGRSSAPDRDRSGVPSAGRINQPRGLTMARREVSGGLPGTRRGH